MASTDWISLFYFLPNNPASLEDLTERLEEESVTAAVNEESVDREESIALVENKTM